MSPFAFGPIYCETLTAQPGIYPVELFNTLSNGVIVLFGLAGFYTVYRRSPRAYDLYLLSAFLVLTGVGSGLWHGLRDPYALRYEVLSGLIFLFALIFFWARRLWTYAGAVLFIGVFYAGFSYSREYWGIAQRWVAIAPIVILASSALIAQTYVHSKRAALGGGIALSLALIALTFRTVDLSACAYIPVGTHFLWHSFLSCAGFVGLYTLTGLEPVRWGRRRGALPDPAE